MVKLFLISISIMAGVSFVIAIYCAMIVAGRSNEQAMYEDNEGADKMFWRRQICPKCKTGRDSYTLDMRSGECPYIDCWNDGKCRFYVPLEKPSKPSIFKRNKNKETILSLKK